MLYACYMPKFDFWLRSEVLGFCLSRLTCTKKLHSKNWLMAQREQESRRRRFSEVRATFRTSWVEGRGQPTWMTWRADGSSAIYRPFKQTQLRSWLKPRNEFLGNCGFWEHRVLHVSYVDLLFFFANFSHRWDRLIDRLIEIALSIKVGIYRNSPLKL